MIITVLAFLACYIPPTVIAAWVRSTNSTDIKAWAPHLAYISIFISSAINPVIYCFRVRRFRLALNQLLQDPCGKSTFQETKRQLRDREQGNVGGAEKGKKIDNKSHEKRSRTYARNEVMPYPNSLTERQDQKKNARITRIMNSLWRYTQNLKTYRQKRKNQQLQRALKVSQEKIPWKRFTQIQWIVH